MDIEFPRYERTGLGYSIENSCDPTTDLLERVNCRPIANTDKKLLTGFHKWMEQMSKEERLFCKSNKGRIFKCYWGAKSMLIQSDGMGYVGGRHRRVWEQGRIQG